MGSNRPGGNWPWCLGSNRLRPLKSRRLRLSGPQPSSLSTGEGEAQPSLAIWVLAWVRILPTVVANRRQAAIPTTATTATRKAYSTELTPVSSRHHACRRLNISVASRDLVSRLQVKSAQSVSSPCCSISLLSWCAQSTTKIIPRQRHTQNILQSISISKRSNKSLVLLYRRSKRAEGSFSGLDGSGQHIGSCYCWLAKGTHLRAGNNCLQGLG